jgi:hypothetical protein
MDKVKDAASQAMDQAKAAAQPKDAPAFPGADGGQATPPYGDIPGGDGNEYIDAPVMQFESEIVGDRSVVTVYNDRIEWAKKSGGLSAGKITAGVLTGGVSLVATGVGKGSYAGKKSTSLDIIRLDAVSGIASQAADKKRVTVIVNAGFQALGMTLPKKEAEQVARVLNNLITAARARPAVAAPVTVQVAPMTAAAPAPIQASPQNAAEQIAKLAELRAQGILSDEEFAAAKAKALGL